MADGIYQIPVAFRAPGIYIKRSDVAVLFLNGDIHNYRRFYS